MTGEEVHEGVELGADLNQCCHAQIGQEGDSIDEKEQQEEEASHLRDIWQLKEKEYVTVVQFPSGISNTSQVNKSNWETLYYFGKK